MLTDAQLFYSNGAQLTISSGAVVFVNGGVELAGNTSLTNDGALTVTKNSGFSSPGNFQVDNASLVSGSGSYDVEQDWINDGTFAGGNSTVILSGNTEQLITTTNGTITQFNNLILTGSGTGVNKRKTLQVNSGTAANGVLTINDRELATGINTFFVYNPSAVAVTYDATFNAEGYVSSIAPGFFARNTLAAGAYIFPTGSASGTPRFRPLIVTAPGGPPSQFEARLNNEDATADGFNRSQTDGTACLLNPLFYHSLVGSSSTTGTAVSVGYLSSADGSWNGISNWHTASSQWSDAGTATASTFGNYNLLTNANWSFDPSDHPVILSTTPPDAPVLNCPTVCENSDGNVFTAQGTTSDYQWTFPGNATLNSGQGTNSTDVSWTTGNGTVSVVAVDASGCTSLPATCDPIVLQGPDVQFTYTSNSDSYTFTDHTAGAASWIWNFGDGTGAASADPTHTLSPGTEYSVSLTVVDNNGCSGTETQLIEYFKEIVIPNVITPNNDGTNDVFLISTPPSTSYDITIVNRWGNVVYHNTDPTKSWDGKLDDTMVTDGVYFYVLKLSTNTQDYRFEGNVSVFQH